MTSTPTDAAVSAHALARPGAVAVIDTTGGVPARVSYADLDRRVDRLASALRADGAGPEQVCVIALDPGVDAVVALLAVLRAGAAFLTLDLAQPQARSAAMVARLGARRVLARPGGPTFGLPVTAAGRTGSEGPAAEPDPRSLAYVSHTSGSTGTPNAVLVERRSMDAYLRALVDELGLGPGTTALATAPLGYDASVRDLLAPLVAGGTTVVAQRSALLRPSEFAATARAHGVTALLSLTPTLLTHLAADEDAAAVLRGIGLAVCSGESLRPFLAAGGRDRIGGALVNQYGPTECTMTSTRHAVPSGAAAVADVVGRPSAGVSVALLGSDLRPVPDGAVGDVHIGGVGVARGYAGDPVLTADRFTPDPDGPPGARAYRTGDLARRLPDGTLEFLGRADRQVKIRGYRVDPAEVEGVLLGHPGVVAAAVTADTDGLGRVHLIAHIVDRGDGAATPALRAHIAAALPPHLMPRRFVRLPRLPGTRSGKTDRAALGGAR